MPIRFLRYRERPRCKLPYSWSSRRGGCRFVPRHDGPCKPKPGRR